LLEGRRLRSWVLAALLAATLLPLARFGQSLWSDEATSIWFARLSIAHLLAQLCDPHPPGFYLLLKAWLVGGDQEAWLRLPSLGASVVSVALTYRLGRDLCGPGCAAVAALLLALHPLQNWYAAEIRMYALAQMLGLAMFWLGLSLSRAKEQRFFTSRSQVGADGMRPEAIRPAGIRPAGVLAYACVALAAFAADYTVLLPFLALQWLWLACDRSRPWAWLGLQAAVILAAALLWLTPAQRHALQHSYHAVFVAVQAQRLGLDLTPATANTLLRLVAVALAGLGYVLAWAWPRQRQRSGYFKRLNFSVFDLIPALMLGGWLLLLLFSITPRLYSVKRQLVLLLPYFALFAAYALARFPRSAAALLAIFGLAITLWVLPTHQREPWREVVAELAAAVNYSTDVIWVDELAVPAFTYYGGDQLTEGAGPNWSSWAGATLPDARPGTGGAVWLLTVEGPYRNLRAFLPPPFLAAYELTTTRQEAGIGLHRYELRPHPLHLQPVAEPPQSALWGLLLPSPLNICPAP
jgi:hypothetical protein